ncbi:MAG: ABC transporter permease [Candidatus Promineifilaceae bacterium]
MTSQTSNPAPALAERFGRKAAASGQHITHIRPSRSWRSLRLGALWRNRELLYFLVWRDLKVRYKQTLLGASWAILQPLATMVVFTIFFGRLAKVPSENLPYALFAYSALVPWTFFANGLTQASNSVVTNAAMIRKIYFPRLTLPIAAVLAGLVDFALAFGLLIGMMFFYRITPTANILWLPLFLLLALLTALGASLWLAALNVQFRDVRYVVPFLVQFWLFASPVAYSSTLLSEPWRTIYGVNPMAGVVDGFRWALLGTDTSPAPMIFVSSAVAVLLFVGGLFYFQRMERSFADIA